MEISSNSIMSSFDKVSIYTSIDVKDAEILLERKVFTNLDLISGETVLEAGVIINLVRLCNMFSYFFSIQRGFFEQVNGLPMGASLSPLLVNCFLRKY